MKNIIACLFIASVIIGVGGNASASGYNDCMYVAKKQGLVKSININNHWIYVDGYFWAQLPYETKQDVVYCFAGYMEEKANGKFMHVKDYHSGTVYAQMSPFGISKINK